MATATTRKSNHSLIHQHTMGVQDKHSGQNYYGKRHCLAWAAPASGEEQAIHDLIIGIASYADNYHYAKKFEPCERLAEDGYAGPYWIAMVSAARKLLSMELGRYDAGTLEAIFWAMLENEGFSEEDLS